MAGEVSGPCGSSGSRGSSRGVEGPSCTHSEVPLAYKESSMVEKVKKYNNRLSIPLTAHHPNMLLQCTLSMKEP